MASVVMAMAAMAVTAATATAGIMATLIITHHPLTAA
jgi:hypothetical protein